MYMFGKGDPVVIRVTRAPAELLYKVVGVVNS